LARDLGDVIHHFLPQKEVRRSAPEGTINVRALEGSSRRTDRPAALPIVSIPIGGRDVVRAAYAWNLAVEVARRGASATLLAPADLEPSPLWPEPGLGPVGVEVVLSDARSFGDLNRAALDIAVSRAADSDEGGVVFVSVPPPWFDAAETGRALMRWILLFAAAEKRDMMEAYSLVKRISAANGAARVGVTIHGVRRVRQAEQAFERLADVSLRYLALSLASYGLLVDDLHVYRAIVARRPIGLEHPQSRAARALRDVAGLLLEDARMQAHA
jgi:hypothetical protein